MEKRRKNSAPYLLNPLKYVAAVALGAFLYSQHGNILSRLNHELQDIKAHMGQETMAPKGEEIIIEQIEEEQPKEESKKNHLEAIIDEEVAAFNSKEKYGHKLTPNIIYHVVEKESKFNPLAVSKKGARGLMQLMPIAQRECNRKGLYIEDAFNPRENISCGVNHLGQLLNLYGGNLELALAAYNAGQGNVKNGKIPPFKETQNYVKSIMKRLKDSTGTMPETTLVAKAGRLPENTDKIRHIVKDGENLYRICTKYGVWGNCDEIAAANGLKSMDDIKPGKVITIAYNK